MKSIESFVTPVFDENNEEIGTNIFLKSDESLIVFRKEGINIILPKTSKEALSEEASISASLALALTSRINDEEWLKDLFEWLNKDLSTSTDEQLMEKFSEGG